VFGEVFGEQAQAVAFPALVVRENGEAGSVETVVRLGRAGELEVEDEVVLTRARKGMVIFVPRGDPTGEDETRPTTMYEGIADYLLRCGARELPPEEVA
jgi:hypothetical protein